LANGYLDLIGRPPNTGEARLELQEKEGFYRFYIPRVIDGYEYDSNYSGIRITIDNKCEGRLLEYEKLLWNQKTYPPILKISKEKAINIAKNYPWKDLSRKKLQKGLNDLELSEPLEVGEPQLSIVSPNYWPVEWKRILFETNLKGCLVWKVPMKFLEGNKNPKWIDVFVDAKDGKVVGRKEPIVILSGAY